MKKFNNINVLSLFDGMSCGQIALERATIKVNNYFASEIDKYAIKVTMSNYPNTIQLGDIAEIKSQDLPKIDLLIGGSPCQGFSFAGKQLNFQDERSKLFFQFVRLLKECNPKYFLLENVLMKKEYENVITKYLNVKPIMINSSLVSAQSRKRLYWTNIPNVTMPVDKKILLKDILESVSLVDNKVMMHQRGHGWLKNNNKLVDKTITSVTTCVQNDFFIKDNSISDYLLQFKPNKTKSRDRMYRECKNLNRHKKSSCLTTKQDRFPNSGIVYFDDYFRFLTPIECERLQTVPDDYTSVVSKNQRYKMLGNGWTVDVISHIFRHTNEKFNNIPIKGLFS